MFEPQLFSADLCVNKHKTFVGVFYFNPMYNIYKHIHIPYNNNNRF